MRTYRVSASGVVNAPAGRVYAILADYRDGHPHIVPRPPFGALEVEQGGVGAGTVIRYPMRLLGRTRTYRAAVTEPEPGRVLVETDVDTGAVTTFTVEPGAGGRSARVTITTDVPTRGGPLGVLERFLVTRLLRPTYVRELRQLADFAEGRSRTPGSDAPAGG